MISWVEMSCKRIAAVNILRTFFSHIIFLLRNIHRSNFYENILIVNKVTFNFSIGERGWNRLVTIGSSWGTRYEVSNKFFRGDESSTAPCFLKTLASLAKKFIDTKVLTLPQPKTKFSLVKGFLSIFCHSLCNLGVTDRIFSLRLPSTFAADLPNFLTFWFRS